MADADRFLGVDHGASRSAADVAGPSRSVPDSASAPSWTPEHVTACRDGFKAGLAEAETILMRAQLIYHSNGQTHAVLNLQDLIEAIRTRKQAVDQLPVATAIPVSAS